LKGTALRLSAALEMILNLLRIRFKIETEEFELLKAHFTTNAGAIADLDKSENSWEDVTNASLSHLLKNSLGKGGGGGAQKGTSAAASNITSSQIKPLQDVEKLKQNITLVCEKISKGSHIEY
jgi:hypothetical protein